MTLDLQVLILTYVSCNAPIPSLAHGETQTAGCIAPHSLHADNILVLTSEVLLPDDLNDAQFPRYLITNFNDTDNLDKTTWCVLPVLFLSCALLNLTQEYGRTSPLLSAMRIVCLTARAQLQTDCNVSSHFSGTTFPRRILTFPYRVSSASLSRGEPLRMAPSRPCA